jgi:hypothetical protein
MTSASSSHFTFPHPTLTPLVGKPTSATIKLLTREVYANAHSVHSTRGGGANGHLATCMPDATYFARAGEAFIIPVHPGPQPVHAAGATGPQITATNRQYDQDLKDFEMHQAVAESIRKQMLEAIASTFYDVLADDIFGYADVTIVQLLTHISSEYGTLTRTDLELNRNRLKETWNPDDEFATLWTKIKTVRQIATDGGDAISDNTTMELTLIALRQAGVYAHAIQTWDDKPDAEQTYDLFKTHFSQQEKIRLRNVTAKAAGYSVVPTIPVVPTPADNAVTDAAANNAQPAYVCNEVALYYCWTHGLSKNSKHTSKLCENKGEGHCDDATIENRKGGINRINFGRSGKQRPA